MFTIWVPYHPAVLSTTIFSSTSYSRRWAAAQSRWMFSVAFVATVVGGMGTIIGPIFGGYFITFLVEYLRPFLEGAWRFQAYALVALAIVYFRPGGFYGMAQDIAGWFRAKRRGGIQYGQVT